MILWTITKRTDLFMKVWLQTASDNWDIIVGWKKLVARFELKSFGIISWSASHRAGTCLNQDRWTIVFVKKVLLGKEPKTINKITQSLKNQLKSCGECLTNCPTGMKWPHLDHNYVLGVGFLYCKKIAVTVCCSFSASIIWKNGFLSCCGLA